MKLVEVLVGSPGGPCQTARQQGSDGLISRKTLVFPSLVAVLGHLL